jgi:hypothetical protein
MGLALTVRPGSDGGSEAPAQLFIIKWQNEPKFNFKQSHICFSRKPAGSEIPDACLVPVHHSTRQYFLRA